MKKRMRRWEGGRKSAGGDGRNMKARNEGVNYDLDAFVFLIVQPLN